MKRRSRQQATGGSSLGRIAVVALIALLFALSSSATAQQATKIPRIGFLVTTPPAPFAERILAFRQALIDLGYVEGQNIALEWRFADGSPDRLLKLAAESCTSGRAGGLNCEPLKAVWPATLA